jgi:hypothetical protein
MLGQVTKHHNCGQMYFRHDSEDSYKSAAFRITAIDANAENLYQGKVRCLLSLICWQCGKIGILPNVLVLTRNKEHQFCTMSKI